MNFDSLVKQLANRINQPQVIRHYLLVVWRTAFKEAEKKQLHIPVVSNQRELLIGYIMNEQKLYCGKPDRELSEQLADDYIDNL